MDSTIALFPLSTVLFPNEPISLNIFESRYRKLIQECIGQDPLFGVVLINEGFEVGPNPEIHTVGTAARLETIIQHSDGRYTVTLIGTDRFRILSTSLDSDYMTGEVEWLTEELDADLSSNALGHQVREEFVAYVDVIAGDLQDPEAQTDLKELIREALSDDPETCSFQIASNLPSNSWQKQALLEIDETSVRLSTLLQLIRRERQMLRVAGPTIAADYRFDRQFSAN